MIELNQVSYTYEQDTMFFDLQICKQERVAILGPSGAGKSTLLSLVAGFIYPDSGVILLNQLDMTYVPPNRRPVAMLFQENNLFTHLTVFENIALGIQPSLRLSVDQKDELLQICEKVGLTDYLKRYPHQLSGGQRQRVAIARCLLQKRPILLLDEPFSSLDPELRLEMLELVNAICEQYALTLVMVTHNIDDAKHIASRAMMIKQGNIIFDDNIDNFLTVYSELS